jgi:hypothetical protein
MLKWAFKVRYIKCSLNFAGRTPGAAGLQALQSTMS